MLTGRGSEIQSVLEAMDPADIHKFFVSKMDEELHEEMLSVMREIRHREIQRFFIRQAYQNAKRVQEPILDFLERWKDIAVLVITATDMFKTTPWREINEEWVDPWEDVDSNTNLTFKRKGRTTWMIDPLFPVGIMITDLKLVEYCSGATK